MAENIPFEIWLGILSYLPERDRKNLYSLNYALFELSMDARYRVVSLPDEKELMGNLERLM